jgi:glycosyltransferase involved in cell wall biosynthesis
MSKGGRTTLSEEENELSAAGEGGRLPAEKTDESMSVGSGKEKREEALKLIREKRKQRDREDLLREEEKLKELSATIRADVKFLGDCEASVVASSLMQSRIFALISDYEGLSFSLIEAMSLGMPIITSMARGNTDVIENNVNGIIVNSNVSDEIAKAISDLLENAVLAKKLGQQAKAKMEKEYNEANQLLKMCDLLLGTKHLNG